MARNRIEFNSQLFADFLSELQRETERACGVLLAAYADNLLREVMTRSFQNTSPKLLTELFDSHGPLASFSGKINVAYALGLVDATEYRDLHLIRKVRNEFAHNLHGLTFTDGRIHTWCQAMKTPDSAARQIHKADQAVPAKVKVARSRFELAGIGICSRLQASLAPPNR